MAWNAAQGTPGWEPGLSQRLRLAEAREADRPEQALAWYMLVVDELLVQTGRRSYAQAIGVLKRARRAAQSADQTEWFASRIAGLRENHRRRPTLIAMLDKAGLG